MGGAHVEGGNRELKVRVAGGEDLRDEHHKSLMALFQKRHGYLPN